MYDLINNKTISALQFLYHGHLDLQTKKSKNTNEGKKTWAFPLSNYVITARFCCHRVNNKPAFLNFNFVFFFKHIIQQNDLDALLL